MMDIDPYKYKMKRSAKDLHFYFLSCFLSRRKSRTIKRGLSLNSLGITLFHRHLIQLSHFQYMGVSIPYFGFSSGSQKVRTCHAPSVFCPHTSYTYRNRGWTASEMQTCRVSYTKFPNGHNFAPIYIVLLLPQEAPRPLSYFPPLLLLKSFISLDSSTQIHIPLRESKEET
jgi:hypothetical protein